MVRVSGWRALVLLLLAGAVALALVLALLWAAALLAVLGLVLWLNLGIIPRLAWRLGVSRWVLDLLVLVGLCACGWLVGGVNGATAGAVAWLGGIGAPRAVGAWMRSRMQRAATPGGLIIEGVAQRRPDASEHPARLAGPSE